MKNIYKYFVFSLFVINAAGCAPVQNNQELSQPKGQQLVANVGGVVVKVKKIRDLPNVFGKADLFGRKVDEGYTELRYLGLTKSGEARFRLTDLDIYSDEDTMSRTGSFSNSSVNGYANQTYANISGSQSTYVARNAHKQMLPPNTSEFKVNFHKKSTLVVANQTLRIIDADSVNLTYIIEQ